MKVRIGTLKEGDDFRTRLTAKNGTVINVPQDYDAEVGVAVLFDGPIRKSIHPDVVVDWVA